jgi:radical SAM protein with 4Fe4S-binding SPASM domain
MIESCYEVPKEQVPERTVRKIVRRYRVSKEKAREDFDAIVGVINGFARDEPPLHLIGMTVVDPGSLKAPSRMDLSLTYQCNNHCPQCYLSENADVKGTLETAQWKKESATAAIHDEIQSRKGAWKETVAGITNAVAAGLSVSINATLSKKNAKELKKLIDFARKLNVRYVSTNAIINAGRGIKEKEESGLEEQELQKILKEAKTYAQSRDISFNWFLPTCYKNVNPVELGFGQRCCSACSVNMMVEPNGDVIPCQSWTQQKLGNILVDPWEHIWNHPVAQDIRNHAFVQEECTGCEHLETCLGACPLDHLNTGGSV